MLCCALRQDFFRNFTSILLFAVVGTILSSLVYGLCTYFLHLAGLITHMSPDSPLLESLMFGSLISAIDPVATLSVMQGMDGWRSVYVSEIRVFQRKGLKLEGLVDVLCYGFLLFGGT